MELIGLYSKRDGYHFYGEDKQGNYHDIKMPIKIISAKQLANQIRDYFRVREDNDWKPAQAKKSGFFIAR